MSIDQTSIECFIARCDRCAFASPKMKVHALDDARGIVSTAGWSVDGSVLCPRCSARLGRHVPMRTAAT